MFRAKVAVIAVALGVVPAPLAAAAGSGCKIALLAELPVTIDGLVPLVPAKFNATPVRFVRSL